MILALVLVAGATLSVSEAAKKDKKSNKGKSPIAQLTTGSDSLSYAAGYVLADILRDRFLKGMSKEVEGTADSLQYTIAYQGLFDALVGDTTHFTPKPAEKFLSEKVKTIRAKKEEQHKASNKAFLDENAKKEGVITLPSGLQYKVLTKGEGAIPTDSDKVQVKYEGRLIDGTVFDSTEKHGGKPVEFTPKQVIKGWSEALTIMPVGSKWQLYIPENLAYGGRSTGSIPAYSTLIFDIELIGIEEHKTASKTEEVTKKVKK